MARKKAIFWTVKLWYGVMVLLLIALNAMSAGGVVNIGCVFPRRSWGCAADALDSIQYCRCPDPMVRTQPVMMLRVPRPRC